MLPDLVILCCRCGVAHKPHALSRMSAAPDGTAPGHRCAIAVQAGMGQGGFGSTVADMDTIVLVPEAGLGTTTGLLCDGCFEALEHVGLLDVQPRPADAMVHDPFFDLFDDTGSIDPTVQAIAGHLAGKGNL
jgi:hypothetical protein